MLYASDSTFLPESKVSSRRKLGDHRAHLFSFSLLWNHSSVLHVIQCLKTITLYILSGLLIFNNRRKSPVPVATSWIETSGTFKISLWPGYTHRDSNLLARDGAWALVFYLKVPSGRGFPRGALVENLPANAGDTGSSPRLGGSHMPRSN